MKSLTPLSLEPILPVKDLVLSDKRNDWKEKFAVQFHQCLIFSHRNWNHLNNQQQK